MDDTKILMLTQGELLGANLFAYCKNNPVMNSDPSGNYVSIAWPGTVKYYQLGDNGPNVKVIEKRLIDLGYDFSKVNNIADEHFGWTTHDAVVEFQKSKGFTQNGYVNNAVWNALFEVSNVPNPPVTTNPGGPVPNGALYEKVQGQINPYEGPVYIYKDPFSGSIYNSYNKIGSISTPNYSVNILWKEGQYYYIEYRAEGSQNGLRRGYVARKYVKADRTISQLKYQNWDSTFNVSSGVEVAIYNRPSTMSPANGYYCSSYYWASENVKVYGQDDESGRFYYIKFNDSRNGYSCRGWIEKSKINIKGQTQGIVDGGVYYIRNLETNKYLDVYGGVSGEGTQVIQYRFHGDNNQLWKVQYLPNEGTYMLYPQNAPHMKLNVSSNNWFLKGNNLRISSTNFSEAKWYIDFIPERGSYKLIPSFTKRMRVAAVEPTVMYSNQYATYYHYNSPSVIQTNYSPGGPSFNDEWVFVTETKIRENLVGSQAYIDEIVNSTSDRGKQKVKMMDDIEGLEQYEIDCISDKNFQRLREKIRFYVTLNPGTGEREHYFRNYLNRVPAQTLDEMVQLNNNLPEEQRWTLKSANDGSLYHMYDTDFCIKGEYNFKFVSSDGLFEAVYGQYNKNAPYCIDGYLCDIDTDPVNMGTYNYFDSITNLWKHGIYDVAPYIDNGNTPDTPYVKDSEKANLEKYKNNEEAKTARSYFRDHVWNGSEEEEKEE